MGGIGLQFVVLDEIDACSTQRCDQGSGLGRGQPDARLYYGAKKGAVPNTSEPARALDSELRTGIALAERLRQMEIKQLDPGKLAQVIKVAAKGPE
jgi:hypothetical protein